jgi:hypothetical protein
VKRALTVAVSQLPLKDKRAVHKFCLLAGVRWAPTPPKDSGIKLGENAEHGYVKISCEDFPEPAMNLKWVSDRLEDLINEANVRSFYISVCGSGLRDGLFRVGTIASKTFLLTRGTSRRRRRKAKRGSSRRTSEVVSVAMFRHRLSGISPSHGFPIDRRALGPPIPDRSNRLFLFHLALFWARRRG